MVKTATQLFIVLSLLFISSLTHASNVIFNYLDANSEQEQVAKQAIIDSEITQLFAALSQNHFPFKTPLTVEFGSDDGPLFDPEINTVQIPYSFYNQTLEYFTQHKYQEKYALSAELAAIDTLLHTLLHEGGHAYIADQNIPILGKEEDAVDNFAAIIMIEYVENGAKATISAADMFDFESEDRPDYYQADEYIDEHSFDLQRYFSTLCLVYGSDPETFSGLLDEIEDEYRDERKESCIEQYQVLSNNWHHYLSKHQNSYF
ncbi:DUF4344 domain-containing metallopeptidase [Vibrio taketomensis]|uniref:DUF4344 domain-containing metallopeptidase n=1 Tax=Vibrio taketomensis TaxID=2572923 RepID=UPI00138A3415|nr:DUF4344 domain-containing metallopeptidase [Vibrio taketomensis]